MMQIPCIGLDLTDKPFVPPQVFVLVDPTIGLTTTARFRRRAAPAAPAAVDGRASVQPPPAAAQQILHIVVFLAEGKFCSPS